MRFAPISSALFSRNRSKLSGLLSDGAVAIVSANPLMRRSGDQFYPYRQNSDFFYLTGIQQEGGVLVMDSDHQVLFIKRPDQKTTLWSGPVITQERATTLSGIVDVKWRDQLDHFLEERIQKTGTLYINREGERPAGLSAGVECSPIDPLMTQLRMVKEPEELDEIKRACAMTRSGFFKVLKRLRPGMMEYEAEAELTAEFISQGARGHAFEPIVACGKNALVLHYTENSTQCGQGELLLMDFGAEVNNYAADCTRTIPVGGRFSSRQRKIYDAVYRIFLQARSLMVEGTLMGDFHNQVGALWEEEHIALGLYSRREADLRPEDDPLWKHYYPHGTSHSMGLDVHDPLDRSLPFRSGMVLTCEPGIYIPQEGIGIRLENDILITESGPVDLMEDIPMEAGEIETLIQNSRSK
ncbi:MAG: aminopeptidase P N-terminal domain-containing protein [Bacteroidota bacterium]